jgi:hypothetical protein
MNLKQVIDKKSISRKYLKVEMRQQQQKTKDFETSL